VGITQLASLDRAERLQLLRFVASFAWADLEVSQEERDYVNGLVARMGLDEEEKRAVEGWLKLPPRPDDLDPALVPIEHRQLFIDAAKETIAADGKINQDELDNLAVLQQLLR